MFPFELFISSHTNSAPHRWQNAMHMLVKYTSNLKNCEKLFKSCIFPVPIHNMGGVAVRALAFQPLWSRVQSPGLGRIICELSLFDVLFSPVPRGFFTGFSGFKKRLDTLIKDIYLFITLIVLQHKNPRMRSRFAAVSLSSR